MEKCKYLEKTQQRFCSEKCRKQYNRRKNPLKKLKAVTTIIGIIGIIVLIGTAGASDLGTITIKQMLYQCAVGIGCLAIAGIGQCLEVEWWHK